MKAWLKHLLVLLCCLHALLPALVAAQEAAATLKSLRGQATIERAGNRRPAQAGETLYPKDRIVTGADGYVGVGFRDHSSLAIGPNSDVDLNKYSFNPTTQQGEQQVRVRSGSMAVISGKLAKTSPEAVKFNTATVTLGVRGTQFVIEAADNANALLWRDAQQQTVRSGSGLCWQSGASAATSSCPADRFVLLPDPSGHVGAISLATASTKLLVQKAYASVQADEQGLRQADLSEAEARARFQQLLQVLPPVPQTFVVRLAAGSADQLTPDSATVLAQVRATLASWPVVPDVDIAGHTDSTGSDAQNDALSLQRAQAVARMIDSPAIQPNRLHTAGRGKRQLLVPTPENTPEPQNRRVEITVY